MDVIHNEAADVRTLLANEWPRIGGSAERVCGEVRAISERDCCDCARRLRRIMLGGRVGVIMNDDADVPDVEHGRAVLGVSKQNKA